MSTARDRREDSEANAIGRTCGTENKIAVTRERAANLRLLQATHCPISHLFYVGDGSVLRKLAAGQQAPLHELELVTRNIPAQNVRQEQHKSPETEGQYNLVAAQAWQSMWNEESISTAQHRLDRDLTQQSLAHRQNLRRPFA